MKKIIALLLCAIVLVSALAGCGNKDNAADGTKPQGNGNSGDIAETEKAGTLVVTANASVRITYGTDGLVLKVEGTNDEGENLMESFEALLGSTCSEVVSKIIRESAGRTYLGRLTYVAVKHEKGSGTPGTNFLEGIESAAKRALETASSNAKLVMITQDKLDADGNINLEAAKLLVEGYLEVEALDGFDGTAKPVDGFYSFQVSFDGMEEEVHMNAATGVVGDGLIGDALQEPEEETEPAETEPAESTPEETAPVENESAETPTVEATQAPEVAG